jgi:hypothetical protein
MVVPSESPRDARFADRAACREVVGRFFSLLLVGDDEEDGVAALNNGSSSGSTRRPVAWEALEKVFGARHGDETSFGASLLAELGTALGAALEPREGGAGRWIAEADADRAIVIRPDPPVVVTREGGRAVELAMGIVRDAAPGTDEGSALEAPSSRLDHAWAIFERVVPASSGGGLEAPTASQAVAIASPGGENRGRGKAKKASGKRRSSWTVRHVLAVVGLKREGAACAPFGFKKGQPKELPVVDEESILTAGNAHGPLAQVLLSTLARSLRGRAALGPPLPVQIPTAVLAFRDESAPRAAKRGRSHWALAHLAIPEECGGPFSVGVSAFGNASDAAFAASSLAVYLHVMTSGMEAATRWLQSVERSPGGPPVPALMSGRSLNFGKGTPLKQFAPDMTLLATPVMSYGSDGYKTSQGELLRATLNLRRLRSLEPKNGGVFWCPAKAGGGDEEEVLVKVTSLPCIGTLVDVDGYLFNLGGGGPRPTEEAVVKIISRSLHGVYVTAEETGLVQLLPNLYAQGFEALRPAAVVEREGWIPLWTAFENFVSETLVPLAQEDIIHPDLRAGYDETANVLYNPRTGSIVMIDLDSLCRLRSWKMRGRDDKRYLRLLNLRTKGVTVRTALDFVYLQVICFAEVWLAKELQTNVDSHSLIAGRGNLLATLRSGIDAAKIESLLHGYRPKFETK